MEKKIDENQNQVNKKIDQMQGQLTETQTQITQLESRLIDAFSKLIEEKLVQKQNVGINKVDDNWFHLRKKFDTALDTFTHKFTNNLIL